MSPICVDGQQGIGHLRRAGAVSKLLVGLGLLHRVEHETNTGGRTRVHGILKRGRHLQDTKKIELFGTPKIKGRHRSRCPVAALYEDVSILDWQVLEGGVGQ